MGKPAAAATATMQCTFGMAPSTLMVLPASKVLIEGKPAATILDAAPIVNIPPFAMCMSLSNPTVAAATAAALGVLTPMPCVPITQAWAPGAAKTLIGGKPAAQMGDKCICNWGGVISILMAGTQKTMVG
jgi:uncharacterized Zn-binding protein involved in type VI secretion